MMRMMKVLCATIVAGAGLSASPVRGDFITEVDVSHVDQGGGVTKWTYSVTNDPASTLYLAAFSLVVPVEADLQAISGPGGWDILYTAGDTTVVWIASDILEEYFPGETAIFSFTSTMGVASTSFETSGTDDDSLYEENRGQIAGPGTAIAAVPEPSSIALLGVASTFAAGVHRRRFKRRRA